ncbi:unnamed protein product [Hymenolepis diminuta]|uniref:SCP domain-containing protein n=1 Tax=Hymenolepis diminuta TaxID=6216 RepID=A0A0R3SR09_HYMDI|nr:unnamed protein product [Hymenolepis diminuta]
MDVNQRLRALHGCKPLTYDPDLAKQAQGHAEYLASKRRMIHSLALDYGENIAKKSGSPGFKLTAHDSTLFEGTEATLMWYSEISSYDFDKGDQVECGHFTQCVWENTERAGFGYAKTREGDVAIVVAQYRPPGNYSGDFPRRVPPPINGKPNVPTIKDVSIM